MGTLHRNDVARHRRHNAVCHMHRVCRVQTRESRLPCLLAFGPLLAENAAQALVPLRVITNESDATRWLAPRVEDGYEFSCEFRSMRTLASRDISHALSRN